MHLIFDLDGTLIDSRAGIVDSLKFATYEVLGTKINSNLLRIGPPIKTMIEEIFPDLPSNKVDEIIKVFRDYYDNEGWKSFSVYPDDKSVLELLKNNNYLYIATNKPEIPTIQILKEINILHLFDKVLCYQIEKFSNKSEMVSNIVLNKNETYLMIGDSLDDCSAASDNNIDFVYCDYGFGHLSLIKERVHCKINQFNDLIKIKGAINVRKY